MLIHQYDAETGQYTSSRLADSDPLNLDRWLVPAFSTAAELPARTPLTWPFYINGAWKLLPDYRGRMLHRQDNGQAAEILVAGTTPAENGLTETPRPSDEYTWCEGAWAIDPAVVAEKARAAAMAEFEKRMTYARTMNNGKADAIAVGLLTPEEAYYFRAWSTYQLALVRAIQHEGFPDAVTWPAEPISFEEVMAPVKAEFDVRMTKAKAFTDGKADAYAAGTLSDQEAYEFRVWIAYQTALSLALERDPLPAVRWPDEPQPYPSPTTPATPAPSSADTAPETPADPA
ncbi:tail fiber assembly protein [Paraburkholderia sp. B3]|uniref:tail fiber assembly protein n=1 Tax=Paraburkholderia sp. B3 TaxID=3134791 RepID=UPI003981DB1B